MVVYHTWDDLPRGTLPIATVEIDGSDCDLCTLLTFTWTERHNKIFLLANPHDCGHLILMTSRNCNLSRAHYLSS